MFSLFLTISLHCHSGGPTRSSADFSVPRRCYGAERVFPDDLITANRAKVTVFSFHGKRNALDSLSEAAPLIERSTWPFLRFSQAS